MKILAVSDSVVDRLYSPHMKEYFPDVDLILGCGDLPYDYLEFLVSSLNVPLLFVPGNHDPWYDLNNPSAHAEGCENIDRRVVSVKGLTIAGLGGSIRYHPGRVNQYSQYQAGLRAASLLPSLFWQRLSPGRRLDILLAHSPPRGIHDDDDLPHHGFWALNALVRFTHPRYLLHGHTHMYKANLVPPVTQVDSTTIINVDPYRVLELEGHV